MVFASWIIGLLGVGAALSPDAALWLRIGGGVIGAISLLLAISETRTGLQNRTGKSRPGRSSKRSWTWFHWTALGVSTFAVIVLMLGAFWIGESRKAREEIDRLETAIASEADALAGLEANLQDTRVEISSLGSQLNTLAAGRSDSENQLDLLQSQYSTELAAFYEETAVPREVAGTLAEIEALLRDLAVSDDLISSGLAEIGGDFADAIEAGNKRLMDSMHRTVDPSAVEVLLTQLDALSASLESATGTIETLVPLLASTDGSGDGG